MESQRGSIQKCNDTDVLNYLKTAIRQERACLIYVILCLIEIDRRKLYLKLAFPSLFQFCVQVCEFSEEATYRRIQAARLCQKFPEILDLVKTGTVNLTTLTLISPCLNKDNKEILLQKVQHKTKKEVLEILASLFPATVEIPDRIRKLPMPTFPTPSPVSPPPALPICRKTEFVHPLTLHHVKIEFRATQPFTQKLDRVKELLKHKYPAGKLEEIFLEALNVFLEKRDPLLKKSFVVSRNHVSKTPPTSRHIPTHIQRAVWQRDTAQCTYTSAEGHRCRERSGLEIDHIQPFSIGGGHSLQNLRLLCRNHNQWRAQKTFGKPPPSPAKAGINSFG